MTPQEIAKKITEKFSDTPCEFIEGAKLPVTNVSVGDTGLVVPAEKIVEICSFLKNTQSLNFDCLSNLTAVDRKDRFEVIYHLFSYSEKHSITLKVNLPREDTAHISTLESLWGCANWLEREVYDLFGIRFDGHSDLRRIMLPDDWIGHPLRKDYKEQDDYHGISTTRPSLIQ